MTVDKVPPRGQVKWLDEAVDIPPMAWDRKQFQEYYLGQWPDRPWAELDKAAKHMRQSGMTRSQIRMALLRSGCEFSAREISETLDRLGIDT